MKSASWVVHNFFFRSCSPSLCGGSLCPCHDKQRGNVIFLDIFRLAIISRQCQENWPDNATRLLGTFGSLQFRGET